MGTLTPTVKGYFTLIADHCLRFCIKAATRPMSLVEKLTTERRSRLAAERLLELKQAELFAANRKLGIHAQQLSEEIVETRAEVETIRGENQRVKSDLSAANEKIAITERRLWQSIETFSDGFALFTSDNEMIMANRAYLSVFDGLADVRPGINYATILQLMTDEGIVKTGNLTTRNWRQMMTERLQEANPKPTVIELWNGAHIKLVDQRGPHGDLVSLGLDITKTVHYEKQLKVARQTAESANRAKSAFLANMSHEIRTPMNGVVGMADVLRDTDLSEEQRLYVDTIRNSGNALLVIINDVLDYSKIEAKKLELNPEPFDLERAIEELLMLLQPSAKAKGLTLALDYDLFLPNIMIGDPGRLRQVFTNLLGNAVKFTNDGHVLVRVTGVPDEASGELTLHVSIEDTGIGIPEEMVGHIFGEFNQVENERNRQFDGTGLGLAITQRLINMMKGQIWVTSEEGVGSCFAFNVPLGIGSDLPEISLTNYASLGKTVIVTEVDLVRMLLGKQLHRLDVPVTSCTTAAEGLTLGGETDLFFVDEKRSTMTGMKFAETIRAAGSDVPIVLLSTRSGDSNGHHDCGTIQGVLHAPASRAELLNLLAELSAAKLPEMPTSLEEETALPRQLRVLAAEDNKTNQLVFTKMIKNLNVDLIFANDGEQAVALYQEVNPDIVFMDISMPRMDGKEATQAIRTLEGTSGKHVPIVAMTAHAMAGDSQAILDAGLDHYLTKPFRKEEIIAQIEEVFDPSMQPLYVEG